MDHAPQKLSTLQLLFGVKVVCAGGKTKSKADTQRMLALTNALTFSLLSLYLPDDKVSVGPISAFSVQVSLHRRVFTD